MNEHAIERGRASRAAVGGRASARRWSGLAWRNGRGLIEQRVTDDPTTLLHELTEAALARGERLRDLSVSRPSLEDVYLELTDDG